MPKIVAKSDSRIMRIFGVLLKPVCPAFMESFWTTIGDTIYYPSNVTNPDSDKYLDVIEHESMHLAQFKKYGVILMALAFVLPLPVLFSGRWWIERGPYLNDIKNGKITIVEAVDTLWKFYGAPYPRIFMRRWFCRNLAINFLTRSSNNS